MTKSRCLVIDTSSLILLKDAPKADRQRVLDHFDGLLMLDELCYPSEVAKELGEQEGSVIHAWAAQNKKAACRGINTWRLLLDVLARVPLVVDPLKTEGEEADGHILALALHLKDAGIVPTVLTEDRRDQISDSKRLTKDVVGLGLWCARRLLPRPLGLPAQQGPAAMTEARNRLVRCAAAVPPAA